MGGQAFGKTAQRLTTAQHTQLLEWAKIRLHKFFPRGINVCRYVAEKATHGDLDLCCAYERVGHEPPKGMEHGGQGGCGLEAPTEKNRGKKSQWTSLMDDVGEMMGAVYWIRAGGEAMFAVPCSVIDAGEGFYEIDLFLAPPIGLDFATFTMSYSNTAHLLGLILRSHTPSITLHLSDLILRHQPYAGIAGIDVHLTDSPQLMCDWLGQDYDHWDQTQFETPMELWKWMVNIKPGQIGVGALKALSRKRGESAQEVLKNRRWWNRPQGVIDFLDWVRSEHSPWYQPDSEDFVRHDGQPKPVLSPEEAAAMASAASMVDPDKPNPLDARAIDALKFWNRTEEYDKILAERRVLAVALHEKQQERLARKAAEDVGSQKSDIASKTSEGVEDPAQDTYGLTEAVKKLSVASVCKVEEDMRRNLGLVKLHELTRET